MPPSACRTSQSTHTVRSPSAARSTIARSERPISRWISIERPSGRPREESRCFRSPVEAGSIPYSALTQPRPRPRSQRGVSASTLAVQITRVRPIENSTEPSAVSMKPGSRSRGRNSSGCAAVVSHRWSVGRARQRVASVSPASSATPSVRTLEIGSCRKRRPTLANASVSPVQAKR